LILGLLLLRLPFPVTIPRAGKKPTSHCGAAASFGTISFIV
jgi:hypothetical protein